MRYNHYTFQVKFRSTKEYINLVCKMFLLIVNFLKLPENQKFKDKEIVKNEVGKENISK